MDAEFPTRIAPLTEVASSALRANVARAREELTSTPTTLATNEIMGRLLRKTAQHASAVYSDLKDLGGFASQAEECMEALTAEEVAEAIIFTVVNLVGRMQDGKYAGATTASWNSVLESQLLLKARLAYLASTKGQEENSKKAEHAVDDRVHFAFKAAALSRLWKKFELGAKPDLTTLCLALLVGAEKLGMVVRVAATMDRPEIVVLSDQFADTISKLRRLEDYLYPIFQPFRAPPAPWSGPTVGPFAGTAFDFVPFVKASYRLGEDITVGVDPMLQQAFDLRQLDPIIDAANIMQSTAWRVCRPVFDVVDWAVNERAKVGKLRFSRTTEMPRLPAEVWAAMSKDVRREYKVKRAETSMDNRQIASDASAIAAILGQAEALADNPFWLPVQIDYRGRLYYLPQLNPQGPDWTRALLEFADAEPIGEEGLGWLMVHLANEGDFDKCSKRPFEERVDWVLANEENILRSAREPKEFSWWQKADHPFGFLAACTSYANVIENGLDTPVHTPVAFDGSNSGVQHYSAALRDPVGGKSVNLIPGDKVEDIYEDVAEHARNISAHEAQADEPSDPVCFWDARGIKRKDVKRQVMTYCYSSTLFRWTKNILRESLGVEKRRPTKEESTNATWLAKTTMDAVRLQLRAAHEGMAWLQQVAAAYAAADKPMTWVSPVGLPVVLKRTVPVRKRLEMNRKKMKRSGDLPRMRLTVLQEGTQIDARAMVQSVGANFIHTLDAAHAALVLLKGREYGIVNFQMIHDSFGTTPARAAALFLAVRESFVEMYEQHDPFAELYERAKVDLGPDAVPPPPPKGGLDITAVIDSRYCFA